MTSRVPRSLLQTFASQCLEGHWRQREERGILEISMLFLLDPK